MLLSHSQVERATLPERKHAAEYCDPEEAVRTAYTSLLTQFMRRDNSPIP